MQQQNKKKRNYNNPERYVQYILHCVNDIPTYLEQWSIVDDCSKNFFHFEGPSTDMEKISEHQRINELYSKYISTKRTEVLDNIDKPQILLNLIEKWMNTRLQKPKEGWSRMFLIYNHLIDRWLYDLHKATKMIVIKSDNEEEE